MIKTVKLLLVFKYIFYVFNSFIDFCTQDQDQDSLLVKRRNDNQSPGPVIREFVPSSHQRREVNLATQSSASSADEIRESRRAFQSLIVWGKKLPL